MADVFTPAQAKRLFGFIAVGGSIGGIVGGLVTSSLAGKLEHRTFPSHHSSHAGDCRAMCAHFDDGWGSASWSDVVAPPPPKPPMSNQSAANSGRARRTLLRSPYLLGLALFLMIYTLTNTWAYSQQSDLAGHQLHDRAARTSFLANIDIAVNTITVLIQVFLTGRLMKWFGVGITLVLMPLLSAVGFAAMGVAPVLTVLATFQILRRAAGFALLRPAREVLFTVLRREDKYKAKSLIDTFGYRFGDQIGAWSYPLMRWFGLGLVGISWVAVPLGAIWCALSIWLGRKQRALAAAKGERVCPPPRVRSGVRS